MGTNSNSWPIIKIITEEELNSKQLELLKEDFDEHIANRANIATLEEGNRVSITFSDYEAGGNKSSGFIRKANGSYILGWKAVLRKGNINAGDLIGLQYNSSSNTFKFILVDQGMFLKTIWHNIFINFVIYLHPL